MYNIPNIIMEEIKNLFWLLVNNKNNPYNFKDLIIICLKFGLLSEEVLSTNTTKNIRVKKPIKCLINILLLKTA